MRSQRTIRFQLLGNSLDSVPGGAKMSDWTPNMRVCVQSPMRDSAPSPSQHSSDMEITFRIRDNTIEMQSQSDSLFVALEFEDPDRIIEFVREHLGEIVGILVAARLSGRSEDILWISPDVDARLWYVGLVWTITGGRGAAVRRHQARRDSIEPFLRPDTQTTGNLFRHLWSSKGLALPGFFPFRIPEPEAIARRLTVRIDPSVSSFYQFPIDLFWRRGLGGFRDYAKVNWIITSKSFFDNSLRLLHLERELNDIARFLQHALVIINTYPDLHTSPGVPEACSTGMELVSRALRHLQDVSLGSTWVSLRYVYNPDKGELRGLLLDARNQYIFANFHVENDLWLLGGGAENGGGSLFSLDFLIPDSLKHIKLLRLFHCSSVFAPFSLQPTSWITQKLLDAGASFVEGSPFREDLMDYLCSLLKVFYGPGALQMISYAKCVSEGRDFGSIKAAVIEFMENHEWSLQQ